MLVESMLLACFLGGGDDRQLEIYDLRGIVSPRASFDPNLLRRGAAGPGSDGGEPGGVGSPEVAGSLIESIAQRLAERIDPDGRCELKRGDVLVVNGTPALHDAVRDLVRSIEEDATVVTVELRILELDESARELVMKLEKSSGEHAMALAFTPDRGTLEALLADRGCSQINAPKVSLRPLAPAQVQSCDEVAYIARYDFVAIEGVGAIADPVVETVQSGTICNLRTLAARTGADAPAHFALRLELAHSEFDRPMATERTDLGVIQRPEVRSAHISATLVGTCGTAFLIGGVPKPAFDDDPPGRWIYALVTVGEPQRTETPRPGLAR